MKNLIALPLLCLCFSLSAQTADTLQPAPNDSFPKTYHGINAGVAADRLIHRYFVFDPTVYGPTIGYYLDMHLGRRTWLFMQFNINTFYIKETEKNYFPQNPDIYSHKNFYFDLDIPVRFAFRTGKENAKLSFYPTVGLGLYVPFYFYEINYINGRRDGVDKGISVDFSIWPYANIGGELKWKYSAKHNIAIGFSISYAPSGENNIPSHGNAYLKFGWNKYKKEKKKTE